MCSVAVEKFGVVRRKMYNVWLQRIVHHVLLFKHRYFGSYPCDYVPTLDNDSFAIINTQLSKIQGEIWIMIAGFPHILSCEDSLDLHSFFNQHYKQMVLKPQQSHRSVCGSHTIYTLFHVFKCQQEEVTGVHDVKLLSFIYNCM